MNSKKFLILVLLIFGSMNLRFSMDARVVNKLTHPIKVELDFGPGGKQVTEVDANSVDNKHGQNGGWCLYKVRVWIDDEGLGFDTPAEDILITNGGGWCGAGWFTKRDITVSGTEIPVAEGLSRLDYSAKVTGGW